MMYRLAPILCTFLVLLSRPAHGKVLDLSDEWVGFEIFGGYHYFSDVSGSRSLLPKTLTYTPVSKDQTYDLGAGLFFNVSRYATVRTGGMYHSHFEFGEKGLNDGGEPYFTSTVRSYVLS